MWVISNLRKLLLLYFYNPTPARNAKDPLKNWLIVTGIYVWVWANLGNGRYIALHLMIVNSTGTLNWAS